MTATNVTPVGGRCLSGSTAYSQCVYGDYIISTSNKTSWPSAGTTYVGIWNTATSTYRKFGYNSSLTDRVVQPVVMDGDPWLVFWARSGADGRALRFDPSDGTILETVTLPVASTPSVRLSELPRGAVSYGGRFWGLGGSTNIIGWVYGGSTTTIAMSPVTGISGWWHSGADVWIYGSGSQMQHYDLASGTLVATWPDPFATLGIHPNSNNAHFVMTGGSAYWPISGSGILKWTPGSDAILIPNTASGIYPEDPFLGPDGQILEVRPGNIAGVAAWNPADAATVTNSPYTGVPAGRAMVGYQGLDVGGTRWYPLSGAD